MVERAAELDRWLSDPHADLVDVEIGKELVADGFRESLQQSERGRDDDLADRVVDPPIVDRLLEIVIDAAGLEVEQQLDIYLERLGRQELVLVEAVTPLEAHVREHDPVAQLGPPSAGSDRQFARMIASAIRAAIDRAVRLGVAPDDILVDPGFGFGKTADHNLELLRELDKLRTLGRPILVGTSRKSTLGRVLDLGPDERLEATLATTAIAIARGADMIRVHDVRANVRAARIADAIIRANWRSEPAEGGPS